MFLDTLRFGRDAIKVFRRAGLHRNLRPQIAWELCRDLVKRRRGSLPFVHRNALAAPEAEAVVDKRGERRLSHRALEGRMNQLTWALDRLGIKKGDRVGVLLRNSIEYLEVQGAVTAVGAISVQIGSRLKGEEIAYILNNSGARVLFFDAQLAAEVEVALSAIKESRLDKDRCFAVGTCVGFSNYESLLAAEPSDAPLPLARTAVGGVMIYTSGTTGHAKGAERDFAKMGLRPIIHFLAQFPLGKNERHLVCCPLYHSAAPAFAMMIMMVGGTNILVEHFDPEAVLQLIAQERATSAMMVPTMYQRIVELPEATRKKYDCSQLRWLMSGAAPLSTELARRIESVFGPILYNFYGATETGLVAVALPGEHTARPGTIGRLIGGNQARLYDDLGKQVPVGAVGELYVKNDMMMDGYFRNQAASAAARRDGFISVGDLAYCDQDGYYYLADRKTDMVISGGVNIYPWEIEQRLVCHPSVADVAILGIPDREWGERLAAFVVLRPGTQATADELSNYVRAKLADYKRPREFHFLDELPRNPTGKVLKRELKDWLLQGRVA